ncbi:MAG: c-type cytochrome [Deltaproteobacteria bacterium]|nr:c-type cytochrome [Deltaproteobacteria bacterium]
MLLLVGAAAFAHCKAEPTGTAPTPTESAAEPSPAANPSAQTEANKPAPTVNAAPRPSAGSLPRLEPLKREEDPYRAKKVALGNALFFDKRLSVDGTRACYSCHMNEDGTGGHTPLAIGAKNKALTRHSPTLVNVAYLKGAFYWDGRAPSLEAQGMAAWAGGNMGVGEKDLAKKAAKIRKIKGYAKMFKAAYPGKKITPDLIMDAIAEYERTLICDDTAYDRFAAGDKSALTEPQQRGLDVFMGKGQCVACHAPPMFSSAMGVDGGVYFNVGIGTANKAESEVDIGRLKVSNNPSDWAAFKPPTLRNVAKSAPYFHDGSVATLKEAVHIMASGGVPNKNKSPILSDRGLTEAESADLVAFLEGLNCSLELKEPKLPR